MRASVWAAVFLVFLLPFTAWAAPLQVSVPPLFGSVPVILASEDGWGLFAEEGLEVSMVPLPSQADQVRAFQAGRVDILISDLTQALMLVSQPDADAVIAGSTYSAERISENSPPPVALVAIGIPTLEELAEKVHTERMRVAVPRRSDLAFMLDELFLSAESTPPAARQVYVGRDNLLTNAGWVSLESYKAGVFPQPYAEFLTTFVAPHNPDITVLSEFPDITVPPTVVIFRRSILEQKPKAAAAFFRSLDRAVEEINALPDDELLDLGWQLTTQLFMPGQQPNRLAPDDRERVEQAIQSLFIPEFPKPAPLDPAVFREVLSWAEEKGHVTTHLEFDEVAVPPVR
ncbi:MAG: hypothetical protein R6U88_05315 [Candidatus Bipolaricaulota bacterium]